MTNMHQDDAPAGDAVSLLEIGTVLLRERRVILLTVLVAALFGLGWGLAASRVYKTTAVFQPQVSDSTPASLALLASQFGFQDLESGSNWGVPVYVELLRRRALLEPVALDSLRLAEEGGKYTSVMDLLDVHAEIPALRASKAVRKLKRIVQSREVKSLNAVELTVSTKWPSVSLFIAQRLVEGLNEFNIETRKSQATAERAFVEQQCDKAEQELRSAEAKLLLFLKENRTFAGAPELRFEHDRLQREVSLRQEIYTTLLQNLEEARIREVRDTPVLTMLEQPRAATKPESRLVVLKAGIGVVIGIFLGVVLAAAREAWSRIRASTDPEAAEFRTYISQIRSAVPRRRSKDERLS